MNPFDRGLAVLFSLVGMLAALLAAAMLAGWEWPGSILGTLAGMPGFRETAYALLAFYLLAGIRLAWQGMVPEKKHAVVLDGSLGKVRVALAAIESLVEKVALEQRGIKEARSGVGSSARGIGIRIKVSAAPDVNIPAVSQAMQQAVREKVLEVTGIEVHNIKVSVEKLASQKLRVE